MSGTISKWFISFRTQSGDGSHSYQLGVVCRGEENKHWAAATPTGTLKLHDNDVLEAAWYGYVNRHEPAEVEVIVAPADDGAWIFDKCDFTYGGCAVKFRQKDAPWDSLEMTINASGATQVLRKAYAEALIKGEPAKFSVTVQHPAS